MPHLGKIWPRQWINFCQIQQVDPAYGPTRKMKLVSLPGTNTGTVAVLWGGLTTISEVAARDPGDPLRTLFTFTNANDSLAVVTVTTKLRQFVPLPTGTLRYCYEVIYESYYSGVFLARFNVGMVFNCADTFSFQNSRNRVATTWQDRTDIPKWSLARFDVCAATWADQPEYHPYRYEP